MGVEEFIKIVKPDLTLYSVFLTFSILSFILGKYFWNFEREIRKENIDRVAGLMGGFRREYIEPFFQEQLSNARTDAYEVSIADFKSDLYKKKINEHGEYVNTLVEDDDIKKVLREEDFTERLNRLKSNDSIAINKYLSSHTVDEIFNQLDKQYESKSSLSIHYYKAVKCCHRVAYSFLILSIFFTLALIKILYPIPEILFCLWLLISLQTFLYGLISFVQLEYSRKTLIHNWENLHIHGRV